MCYYKITQTAIDSFLQNINHIKLGVFLGLSCVSIFFIARILLKKKTYAVEDIIKSLGFGFTLSLCLKIGLIGYFNECDKLEFTTESCMIIGGFALAVFAVDGLIKSVKKEDPPKNKD
ncbi:hypothetical protein [Flavivirga sp. 57AJ16]|uniref:hypothetical protein n=1 Tax=Flavivirga sp. 57AJ16 TaxID=3025307 RepID=UPI002366FBDF|nr:hypothetical protein [Flavivirga sp. 57AJ16]MDD7888041.1 hypothetical protein [Flavivirga sp. 57AJ16]